MPGAGKSCVAKLSPTMGRQTPDAQCSVKAIPLLLLHGFEQRSTKATIMDPFGKMYGAGLSNGLPERPLLNCVTGAGGPGLQGFPAPSETQNAATGGPRVDCKICAGFLGGAGGVVPLVQFGGGLLCCHLISCH